MEMSSEPRARCIIARVPEVKKEDPVEMLRGATVKTKLLFLLIMLGTLANAATFNRSTGNGLASDGTKWSTGVSPCGQGGDNVFVVVQTNIALNCTLGSAATGLNSLRIESGGSVYSYDGTHAACGYTSTQDNLTLYLNSTGTDPIGSGSKLNPGSDATAFGIYVAYGTFCYQGDVRDLLTLTAANRASPIYFVHEWDSYSGGIGIGTTGETGGAQQSIHGAASTCYYCKFVNLGNSSFPAQMEGLAYSLYSSEVTPTNSLDIEHSEFDSSYEFTNGNTASWNNHNWTMEYDWWNGPTSRYDIRFSGGSSGTFVGNTETGATTTGQMVQYGYPPASTVTWQGNVSVGSTDGTIQRGQLNQTFGGGPMMVTGNLCLNAEGTVTDSSNCWTINTSANDTASIFSSNIAWGTYVPYRITTASGGSSGPRITNNWGAIWKEATSGQGVIDSSGYYLNIDHNVMIVENTNGSGGLLVYSGAGASAVFKLDNNTIYFATAPILGTSYCYAYGDLSGSAQAIASPSWFRSNICVGLGGAQTRGLTNNVADNFSATQCDTAGLCNNLMYNVGTPYCNGTTCTAAITGAGYWDGVHAHPGSVYNDLASNINPQFIDPTRRPMRYSTNCGGEGTIADLGTQYSYRDGLGTPYNSCYDISKMLLWLQVGFMPLNQLLRHAGFGGTYVGAIPPLPIIGGL
jgi:hypothetical protein